MKTLSFAELKPTAVDATTETAIRVDEHKGAEDMNGLEVQVYGCSKLNGRGEVVATADLYSTIKPSELQVREDGTLDETFNRLSRKTAKSGNKQAWIVDATKGGITIPDGVGF